MADQNAQQQAQAASAPAQDQLPGEATATPEVPEFNPDQAQEYFEAYKNQQNWQRSNTERAQEISQLRRNLDAERNQWAERERGLNDQLRLALQMAQQQRQAAPTETPAVPNPYDDGEAFQRWGTTQQTAIGQLRQELQTLRQQQQTQAQQNASWRTNQAIGRFRDKHPDLTDQQYEAVGNTVRQQILPSYTEDGVAYYDLEQLEAGLRLVTDRDRLEQARREGAQQVVQSTQQARAAQGVSGRTSTPPAKKGLEHYADWRNNPDRLAEFMKLPEAERIRLMTPPEQS